MSMLSRSPKSKTTTPDLDDEQLRWLPPGFSDERSEFYVEPEVRDLYVAEASNLRKQRMALTNAEWGMGGPNGYATTTDAQGRTVTAKPKSMRVRVHEQHLSAARTHHAQRLADAEAARRRREHAVDVSRCALCGVDGLDPHPATGHFLTNAGGAFPPAYGIAGRAVRLHPACAAAVNVAARERVDPALVDTARGFLAKLDD